MWTVLDVRSKAEAADADLQATRAELDIESMLDGDGIEALRRSAAQFDDIERRLDSPFLAPVRLLPVGGRQLSAASHQASAAGVALRTAVDMGSELEQLVDSSMRSGPERVAALREVHRVVTGGRAVFEDLDLGPSDGLVGQLHSARVRIEEARVEALDLLVRAAEVSDALATFFEGPTDYLLLAANNAQMQNGQGMFLSAGVLHVEAGRMDLASMEPTADLPPANPPAPLDPELAARWGWLDPNTDFRHLGLTHRFPVTAHTAVGVWAAAGRPPVDGVMVVDPFVLRAIMEATGPIQTPGGSLGPDVILPFILHDQYQGYLDAEGGDTSFGVARRDQLEQIATDSLSALERLESVEPPFVEALAAAARGRHLLAWAGDPAVQAGWKAAGIDGQITPDSLMLSIVNRSGNKLDWFLHSSAELTVEPDADGYDAVVRVAVSNLAPPEGEPAYVVGPYPGSGLLPGEYLGLVTLNLPAGATQGRFDGVDPLAVAGPDGANRTIAAWVRVQRGTTTELVARFRLPADMTDLRVEPSGRAMPSEWTTDQLTWTGNLRWTDAEAYTVELPQDG